jgi:hypothetical protein
MAMIVEFEVESERSPLADVPDGRDDDEGLSSDTTLIGVEFTSSEVSSSSQPLDRQKERTLVGAEPQ